MSFADKIKTSGVDFKSKRLILLEGPNGVGKTFQFRTLIEGVPEHNIPPRKGLFATTENKQATLEGLEFPMVNISTFDFPLNATEKKDMLKGGGSDLIEMLDFLRYEDHDYDFVYFDSIMRYAWRMIEYLKGNITNSDGDKDTRRAYFVFGQKMKKFLDTLSQISSGNIAKKPVHFIGTWGIEIGVDYEGKRQIVPLVDGKMVGPEIGHYFDDIFMMGCRENAQTGEQSYVLYTMGTKEFAAKKSSPFKLPPCIKDPNLSEIIAVLEGKLDAKVLKKA